MDKEMESIKYNTMVTFSFILGSIIFILNVSLLFNFSAIALSLISLSLYLVAPYMILITNFIALFLSITAITKYHLLNTNKKVMVIIALTIEIINLPLFLYIKSLLSI
jgi:hypothetical protein